jgi:prevent-host-death family protein
MQKIIGVTELQRHFRSVFNQVVESKTPYILTRGSRPEAALISYEEFIRFQAFQEREVLARFDQLMVRMAEQNAGANEKDVAADIDAALAELDG